LGQRVDHKPPRAARTRTVFFLTLALTSPLEKFTLHAFAVLLNYEWFTEGFDTPDLREARILLTAWP
jgi:hypothetical protein